MALTSAIKGATVPTEEITSTIGYGRPLNDLVNSGIISPAEGGAKFTFNQDYSFPVVSPYVSDSSSVVQNEKNTIASVGGLSVPSPAEMEARTASENYIKTLEEQSKALETRRAAEEARINSEFNAKIKGTEEAQKKETGATTVALQRIGGFLGGSASAVGALNNLAQTHRTEIGALEAKKQSAISEANNAITDKQFTLASLKAKEAKDLSSEINSRRDKFFTQALSLVQEQRQKEQVLRDDARQSLNTIISNFGGIDLSSLDENTRVQLESLSQISGIPMASLVGPTSQEKSDAATERQRQITNAISIANLSIRTKEFQDKQNIDALEAQRLGLPRQLVGTSEDAFEAQLKSEAIPPWFIEIKTENGEITQTTTKEQATKLWNFFRNEVLKTNPLIDFGGAGLPPPVTESQ